MRHLNLADQWMAITVFAVPWPTDGGKMYMPDTLDLQTCYVWLPATALPP
jgi:hypothetical protein